MIEKVQKYPRAELRKKDIYAYKMYLKDRDILNKGFIIIFQGKKLCKSILL